MEDLIKRPIYWFKRKREQIGRLIDFFPIIWNSYDWEYTYAIQLFKKQLERMANHMESDYAALEEAEFNAKKIRTAIRLMDKVYSDFYTLEYIDIVEEKYGDTIYDFEEHGTFINDDKSIYTLSHRNELAVNEDHQKQIDEERHQLWLESRARQKRAHRVLWKFIEHNIQEWFD